MAVTPSDFIEPNGEIQSVMFPNTDDVEGLLQGFINKGTTELASDFPGGVPDNALTHYVYKRAYTSVYLRMSAEPQSFGVSETLNYQYVQAQGSRFRELAKKHDEALQAILNPTKEDPEDDLPTSGSVGTSVSY